MNKDDHDMHMEELERIFAPSIQSALDGSKSLGSLPLASDAAPAISPSAGPWSVSTGDKTIINSPERYVCEVFDWSAKETAPQYQDISDKLRGESEANARLIAASPDIWKALVRMEYEVSQQDGITEALADALEDARAVLQKLI